MAGYVIAEVDVVDLESYQEYVKSNTQSVARHGGRFIVRDGRCEVMECEPPPGRIVVIEFPSFEAARAWHDSPEYQAVISIRQKHARTSVLAIIEGT